MRTDGRDGRIALIGHAQMNLAELARLAPVPILKYEILNAKETPSEIEAGVDCAVFLTSVEIGISQALINYWNYFAERLIPRILLVSISTMSDIDFDDIVLIGVRTLEQLATPYLVVHGQSGEPIGLIDISTNKITDYSSKAESIADSELIDLVRDFQIEYQELIEAYGDEGFSEGLVAIALPIQFDSGLGLDKFQNLLEKLTKP